MLKEIAVIGVNPDYKDTLLSILPLDGERILNVDIYQMEIDTDLMIMLYDLDFSQEIPPQFLEHIKPHLSGILIVGDWTLSAESIPGMDFVNDLIKTFPDIPVIMGVCMDGEDQSAIAVDVENRGLNLSQNSLVVFWKSDDVNSMKNIWRGLLVDLEQSAVE